jgi:hypothetical protein
MTADDEDLLGLRRLRESLAADRERLSRVPPRALTAQATSPDGSVTVEVGIGGGLRGVRLSPAALRMGAPALARTILRTAAQATALANQRGEQSLRGVLRDSAGDTLGQLGMAYDPALLEDDRHPEDLIDWRRR